jgi:uncharacterized protein
MVAISYVTWGEVEQLVDRLYERMTSARYEPTQVVAVGRGGMVPARLVADAMGIKDIELLPIRRYDGLEGKQVQVNHLNGGYGSRLNLYGEGHGSILLVDDVCDRGETLAYLVSAIGARFVSTAVLHLKPHSTFQPDFYGRKTENGTWLSYPWERRESP